MSPIFSRWTPLQQHARQTGVVVCAAARRQVGHQYDAESSRRRHAGSRRRSCSILLFRSPAVLRSDPIIVQRQAGTRLMKVDRAAAAQLGPGDDKQVLVMMSPLPAPWLPIWHHLLRQATARWCRRFEGAVRPVGKAEEARVGINPQMGARDAGGRVSLGSGIAGGTEEVPGRPHVVTGAEVEQALPGGQQTMSGSARPMPTPLR